jgi:hypothetical protein
VQNLRSGGQPAPQSAARELPAYLGRQQGPGKENITGDAAMQEGQGNFVKTVYLACFMC